MLPVTESNDGSEGTRLHAVTAAERPAAIHSASLRGKKEDDTMIMTTNLSESSSLGGLPGRRCLLPNQNGR